jgi:hypothetical protein
MTNGTAVLEEACSNSSRSQDVVANPGGLFPLVMLSAWCGLVAGLLEVGVIIFRKRVLDSDHLYKMSRHLVWLIPSINLTIFLLLGVFCRPSCGVGAVAALGSARGCSAH